MWRIIPILVCVIYAAVAVLAFSLLMGVCGLATAWTVAGYAFWTLIGCCVLLAPVTIPFTISKSFK